MSDIKSINGLMKYLREKHKIKIAGSVQKQKLRNIGYYHGFKGYRYINKPNNKIKYYNFDEVLAVNNFDMKLKSLLYPKVMFIEMALKNYALEVILDKGKSSSFNYIFDKLITDYKDYKVGSDNYKKAMSHRLSLRDRTYKALTNGYSNGNRIIEHFYFKDENVPIWAIFECITFGEFGNLISCLNKDTRCEIEKRLGFNTGIDTNSKFLEQSIFALRDLRNSIAHNNIIFDTRFKTRKVSKLIKSYVKTVTGIPDIMFNNITDYIILITYLLKLLNEPKRELIKFLNDFNNILECFEKETPSSINSKVIYTNTRNKINLLKEFI